AIERKSLADLYSTLGQHRERFEAEIERLSYFDFAAVVIEAPWRSILLEAPERSKLEPKTISRTCFAWTQRYGVPWFTFENRAMAEIATYRMLDRWWRDEHEGKGRPRRVCRRCGGPFAGGPFGR